MRIFELIAEQQTIGSVGSTTGITQPIGKTPTTGQPSTGDEKADPNVQKLAATLKQHNLVSNEKEVNDFMSAWQAQQTGKTLDGNQQAILAKLGPALLKNKNLDTQLDLQIKSMSQVKPGNTTTPQQAMPGVTK